MDATGVSSFLYPFSRSSESLFFLTLLLPHLCGQPESGPLFHILINPMNYSFHLCLSSQSSPSKAARLSLHLALSPQKVPHLVLSPQKVPHLALSPQKVPHLALSPQKVPHLALSPHIASSRPVALSLPLPNFGERVLLAGESSTGLSSRSSESQAVTSRARWRFRVPRPCSNGWA